MKNHVVTVPFAILIGIICGLIGIIFTVMNVKISRLRDELLKERKWWRVGEPCILALLFVTGTVVLPKFVSPCVQASCVLSDQVSMRLPPALGRTGRDGARPDVFTAALPYSA